MLEAFSHPMLFVDDLERAVAFYVEKLGFAPNFVIPDTFASLRHERMGCRVDLHPTETASRDVGYGPIPYFRSKDVEATLRELAARGVKVGEIRREGGGPRFATFWDSEGNALGVEEG